MYWVFGTMTLALIVLTIPNGHVVLQVPEKVSATGTLETLHFSLGVIPFTVAIVLLGVGMGIGKAAVYKHIPEYFPKDVGSVGGLVGLIGALGGFVLPPLFAYAFQWTGLPTSTFAIMLAVTIVAFAWMHVTILRLVRKAAPSVVQELEVREGLAQS
jgi:NNP family nitrate/nitrite transporter-like MFS transporter